ncbi:hypothetical protein [Actinoplanes sp. G11-F43]
MTVVAEALAAAGFDQLTWIDTAVSDVFLLFARDRDAAVQHSR